MVVIKGRGIWCSWYKKWLSARKILWLLKQSPHLLLRQSYVAQAGLNSIYSEANLELLICWLLHLEFPDYRWTPPQPEYVVQESDLGFCTWSIDTVLTEEPPQLLSIHLMESQLEQTLICLGNERVILIWFCTLSLHTLHRALWWSCA